MKRNLLYFVYPRKGSSWQWNVEQIRPFLPAFNGRKIVGVALDEWSETKEDVAQALGDQEITYLTAANDQSLQESVTFLDGMRLLYSTDPGEITFYAHAKGIRHGGDRLKCVLSWARTMYVLNLSAIPLIEWLMGKYFAVGCFRKHMSHYGSPWHFSGNFFWMKHSAIFSRNWTDFYQHPFGVEAYIGRHIRLQESFQLTEDKDYGNLYKWMQPEAEMAALLGPLLALMKADLLTSDGRA